MDTLRFVREKAHFAETERSFRTVFRFLYLFLAAPLVTAALDNPPIIWTTRIGTLSDSSPAVAPDGTIYAGSFDGKFWALNPDGSVKWIFSAGREIKSSPAVAADGTIYFGSRDRKFYAVDARGHEKWHFQAGAWVDCSPGIASDRTVYFGSWDKSFYALNPDGAQKWVFPTAGVIDSSPAIGLDGTIHFGSHDHWFYALTPAGRLKWKFETGGPVISSPAIEGQRSVCFTSVDGYCYMLNLDGSLRWKVRTGGVTPGSPVFAMDGSVFVTVNNQIWILSRGGQPYKTEFGFYLEDPSSSTPIAFSDGSVGVVGGWGNFMKFQIRPPDFQWRMGTFVQCSGSPGITAEGMIYLPGVIAVRGGVPLAKSSWPKFRGNPRNTGNVADNVAATKREPKNH